MNKYEDPYAGLSPSDQIKLMEAHSNRSIKHAESLDKHPELDKLLTKVDKVADRYEIIKKTEGLVAELEKMKESNPNLAWHIKGGKNGSELIIETNIPTKADKALKLAVGSTVGFEEGSPTISAEGKPLFQYKQRLNATPDEQLHYKGTDTQIRHSEYSGKDPLLNDLKSYVDGKEPEFKLRDATSPAHTAPEVSSHAAGASKTTKMVAGASKVIGKATTPLAVGISVLETKEAFAANDGHGAAEAVGSGVGALAAAGAAAKALAHGVQKLGEAALSDPRAGKIKLAIKGLALAGTAIAGAIGGTSGGEVADEAVGGKLHEVLNPPANKAETPTKTDKKDVAASLSDKAKNDVAELVSKMNGSGIQMPDKGNIQHKPQYIASKPHEAAVGR